MTTISHSRSRQQSAVRAILSVFFLVALFAACTDSPTTPDDSWDLTFEFEQGHDGWMGDFVGYPTSKSEEDMDLMFDHRALPADVDESNSGLFLSGRNESDDLFMYLRHRISGLIPSTTYLVSFRVSIASNAPTDCAGIGGPPGEAVVGKVGASIEEPVRVVEDDHYRLSVDKDSDQADSRPASSAKEIGNIANGLEQCTGEIPYQMITLQNPDDPLQISTIDDGTLWLFVGTDSGFEGTTAVYYDAIEISLWPQ